MEAMPVDALSGLVTALVGGGKRSALSWAAGTDAVIALAWVERIQYCR